MNLPSGLTVAIYADEGRNNSNYHRRLSDEPSDQSLIPYVTTMTTTSTTSSNSDKGSSTESSSDSSTASNNLRAWTQYQHLNNTLPYHRHLLYSDQGSAFPSTVTSKREFQHSIPPLHSYDLGTFLRFAIKSADCLEFVHRHGGLHGELRPTAFQWNGDDNPQVKLWNFGSGSKSYERYKKILIGVKRRRGDEMYDY